VSGPSPRRIWTFAAEQLRLKPYLRSPGDGRRQGDIAARDLYWSMLIGQIMRTSSFLGVEALVGSSPLRALKVGTTFGDDALAYFTERLDPDITRQAAVQAILRAKRNKAFDETAFIGLAVDGTTGGRSRRVSGVPAYRNQEKRPLATAITGDDQRRQLRLSLRSTSNLAGDSKYPPASACKRAM
jgi:hypothetical protein